MWIYLLIFLIVFLLYNNSFKDPQNKHLLYITMLLLALFVGLGDMLGGYDRYIYGEIFDYIADATANEQPFSSMLDLGHEGEVGFVFVNYLIAHLTSNRYIFILIYTLLLYLLFSYSISKYVDNYLFGVILFLGLLFFFTFTYLRQMLSAAICWLALAYVIDRKPIYFLGIVFAAILIHNGALVFAPFFFLPVKKLEKQTVIIIMIICFFLGVFRVVSSIFTIYSSAGGSASRITNYGEAEGYFRIDYILEAVFFLWIILSNYAKIGNDKKSIIMLNMSLIFCAILLLFVSAPVGGRMGWYYMLGIIATLTTICHSLKVRGRSTREKFRKGLLFVSFLLFFRIVFLWGILLYPYKTFLTNGYRQGDNIHNNYEYDPNYDKDKFYR